MVKALATTKLGRGLLQSVVGKKGYTEDGNLMVIENDLSVSSFYDQKVFELLAIANYQDITEALQNTEEGQKYLTWFQTINLSIQKGPVNYDRVLNSLN